jgi:hypothetical protein
VDDVSETFHSFHPHHDPAADYDYLTLVSRPSNPIQSQCMNRALRSSCGRHGHHRSRSGTAAHSAAAKLCLPMSQPTAAAAGGSEYVGMYKTGL